MIEPTLFDHAIAVLFGVAAPLYAAFRSQPKIQKEEFTSADRVSMFWANGTLLFLLAGIVLWVWWHADRSWVDLGVGRPDASDFAISGAILLPYFVWYVYDVRRKLATPEARAESRIRWDRDTPFMPRDRRELAHSSFICLGAGVGEEIFFRGHLILYGMWWLGDDAIGVGLAVLLPALIFGLAHRYQGPKAMAQIAVMACFFGAAYVATGNLWPLIVVHSLIDLIGISLGVWMLQVTSPSDPSSDHEATSVGAG